MRDDGLDAGLVCSCRGQAVRVRWCGLGLLRAVVRAVVGGEGKAGAVRC